MLEGIKVPLLFHFGGLRSTFNAAFLQSIDFVPGNFGPDYGRATGGIIDIRVRDPATDMFRGEVDVPEQREPRVPEMNWVSRKAILPGDVELRENPRARSAQLRVLEKI